MTAMVAVTAVAVGAKKGVVVEELGPLRERRGQNFVSLCNRCIASTSGSCGILL
jgi:hypothetical protein